MWPGYMGELEIKKERNKGHAHFVVYTCFLVVSLVVDSILNADVEVSGVTGIGCTPQATVDPVTLVDGKGMRCVEDSLSRLIVIRKG